MNKTGIFIFVSLSFYFYCNFVFVFGPGSVPGHRRPPKQDINSVAIYGIFREGVSGSPEARASFGRGALVPCASCASSLQGVRLVSSPAMAAILAGPEPSGTSVAVDRGRDAQDGAKDKFFRGVQATCVARGGQIPKQREAHTIDGAACERVYRSEGCHDQALMGSGRARADVMRHLRAQGCGVPHSEWCRSDNSAT